MLDSSSSIFKLVGPVLVKQDRTEAFANVKNRLDLINAEMYVRFELSMGIHLYFPNCQLIFVYALH